MAPVPAPRRAGYLTTCAAEPSRKYLPCRTRDFVDCWRRNSARASLRYSITARMSLTRLDMRRVAGLIISECIIIKNKHML